MLSEKRQKLDEIYQDIIKDEVCLDLAEQANRLVEGFGGVDSKIMCIGEAPGKSEDEKGLPFIGASGKFLDKLCEEAGINREELFITNIVKYRPPNNRDPKKEEKASFWPYLEREIDVLNPNVILTFGKHPMACFLPEMKISDIHGQIFKIEVADKKYTLIPLYHPAAALYNGNLRQILIDDFVRVGQIIKNDI